MPERASRRGLRPGRNWCERTPSPGQLRNGMIWVCGRQLDRGWSGHSRCADWYGELGQANQAFLVPGRITPVQRSVALSKFIENMVPIRRTASGTMASLSQII